MEIHDFLENDQNQSILCHYTSKEIAIEHILTSMKIRFSPLRATNDPKENKERLFTIGYRYSEETEKIIKKGFYDIINKLQEMLLDFTKVLCLTRAAENNPYKLNTKRAFGRPRMWSQYADKHRGICLVFDRQKLGECITSAFQDDSKNIFSGSVQYEDFLKSISSSSLKFNFDRVEEIGIEKAKFEHLVKFKDAFFFRKDSDWSGESEWRWIIHTTVKGYEYVEIEKSLQAVILGHDFPVAYLPSIKNLLDKIEVDVIQLKWDSNIEDFNLIKK